MIRDLLLPLPNCNRNIFQHENVSGAAAHAVVSRDLLYGNVLICRVELHAQCSQPSRPSETTKDGTGRPNAVRPRVGRKRCRLFEAGRRQTDRTVGDGVGPSPVVIYRHPWIFLNILNSYIKLITIILTLKQDPLASAPSVQFYRNSV